MAKRAASVHREFRHTEAAPAYSKRRNYMKIHHSARIVIYLALVILAGCGSGSESGSETGTEENPGQPGQRFRKTKDITYTDSGDILKYTRFEYDDQGNVNRQTDYESPGTDGKWFTADDSICGYGMLNAAKSEWNYFADSTDGKWFDDNDQRTMYREITTDSTGRIISEFEHRIGADMTFNTDDDPLYASRYVRGTDYLIEFESSAREFGPDGIPFTQDDTGGTYTKTFFGTDGLTSEEQFFYGAGPDGEWFTSDDLSDERVCYIRNGAVPLKKVTYRGPGADGIWNSSDDEIDDIAVYENGNAPGEYRVNIVYAPGDDGKWETQDDLVTNAAKNETFDPYGNMIRQSGHGYAPVGYEYEPY